MSVEDRSTSKQTPRLMLNCANTSNVSKKESLCCKYIEWAISYKSCVYCEWSRWTIRCKLWNIYYELLVKIRTHIWTMSPLISLIGYLKWLTNYPNNRKTPLTLFKLRYCSLNSICGASDIQFSSVQDILKSSLDSRGPLWHYGVSLLTREITSVSVLLSQYSLKWNNFSPQETGGLIQ